MPNRKIVRDNKPSLPWWRPEWVRRIAKDEQEHIMYLTLKIDEERGELLDASKVGERVEIIEELADLYDIAFWLWQDWKEFCEQHPAISDIIYNHSITIQDIQEASKQKTFTHGWFTKGVLLDLDTVLKHPPQW